MNLPGKDLKSAILKHVQSWGNHVHRTRDAENWSWKQSCQKEPSKGSRLHFPNEGMFQIFNMKVTLINTLLVSTKKCFKSLSFAEELQFYHCRCLCWWSSTNDCCFHFWVIVVNFCVHCPLDFSVNWISEPLSHFSFCVFLIFSCCSI